MGGHHDRDHKQPPGPGKTGRKGKGPRDPAEGGSLFEQLQDRYGLAASRQMLASWREKTATLTADLALPGTEPGALAEYDALRGAIGPGAFALLQDGRAVRVSIGALLPPYVDYLSRDEMLEAYFSRLGDENGPAPDAATLLGEIIRNEGLRRFLEPKVGEALDIVPILDEETPRLELRVGDVVIDSSDGTIAVEALDRISIATLEQILHEEELAATQLVALRILEAQSSIASTTMRDLATQIAAAPGDHAFEEVRQLRHAAKDLVKRARETAESLHAYNADLQPWASEQLGLATAAQTVANHAQAVATAFRDDPGREVDLTNGEIYDEAAAGYADDAGLSPSGALAAANYGATKVFQTLGDFFTAGNQSMSAANASAYRNGLISWNAYQKNITYNFGKSLIVAGVTALSAGWGGRATAAWFGASAGYTATGTAVLSGTVVGGFAGTTGAMASDAYSWIVSKASSDPGVRQFQASTIGGPASWLTSGLAGAMVGGTMGWALARFPAPPRLDFAKQRGVPQSRWSAPPEFHALIESELPPLPRGYRWSRMGNEWRPLRAPDLPEASLSLRTYGIDSQGKPIYGLLMDRQLLYVRSTTRPVGNTYQGPRKPPMATNDYVDLSTGKRYVRGHGVDQADTPVQAGRPLSATDPLNFSPEEGWWGMYVRNPLVGAIRRAGGGYLQMNFYGRTPQLTANGTPIPEAVFFVETLNGRAVRAWRIPYGSYNYAAGPRGLAALPQFAIPLAELPPVLMEPPAGAIVQTSQPGLSLQTRITFSGYAGSFDLGVVHDEDDLGGFGPWP